MLADRPVVNRTWLWAAGAGVIKMTSASVTSSKTTEARRHPQRRTRCCTSRRHAGTRPRPARQWSPAPSARRRPRPKASEVLMEMEEDDVTHFPVVNEGRVVGVIGRDRLLGVLRRQASCARRAPRRSLRSHASCCLYHRVGYPPRPGAYGRLSDHEARLPDVEPRWTGRQKQVLDLLTRGKTTPRSVRSLASGSTA